jgi:hypothetical protein
VGLLDEERFDHLFGHVGAAEGDGAGGGRFDEDVGAGAAGAILGVLQHAAAQADDGEDHGDLKADGQRAECGAQPPVLQVFNNKAVDHFLDSSLFQL